MPVIHEDVLVQENEVAPLISHILVPVEFSKRSTAAAKFAISLAHRFHSKVALLHVEKPVENDAFWTREVTHWAKDQMAGFLQESANDSDVRRLVDVQLDVAGEILRRAADTSADLIVMPTHAYGPIHRILLGSVTARVLREATCPVWTTTQAPPVPPARWLEPERILCAVDSEPDGADVLSWASILASHLDARVSVVWSQQDLRQRREELERLERAWGVHAEAVIEAGDLPDALRRAAAGMQAGLLVVSRNFGKPAEPGVDLFEVVRKAGCPVVCV